MEEELLQFIDDPSIRQFNDMMSSYEDPDRFEGAAMPMCWEIEMGARHGTTEIEKNIAKSKSTDVI